MIPISNICDCIVVMCPKCKTGQMVKEWGLTKCGYEGCGNEWEVSYSPEILLKEAVVVKKQLDMMVSNRTFSKWKPPIIRKLGNGNWIAVDQGYEYIN